MPAGRPRGFDIEKALDRALDVFWRKGYEGATLPDLTEAMGINRPSLYAAFGNKEQLFRRAMDRYSSGPACRVGEALREPTTRAAIERLLREAINLTTCPDRPKGCFMVQGALACGDEAEILRHEMAERRKATELAVRTRLETDQAKKELCPDTDPSEFARYICTVLHGMAVQAASGATPEELNRVVDQFMDSWPGVDVPAP